MFNSIMGNKGFIEFNTNVETQKDVRSAKKPLKSDQIVSNRVDINILKSKLQETESKEFKKNMIILSALILCFGFIGIYLSF